MSEESAIGSVAAKQSEIPFSERDPIAPPRDNVTVMTGQGFGDRPGDALIALAPDGRTLYYNDSYAEYQDVDPSPEGSHTVLFVASENLNASQCGATTRCVRDVVERVNLTTGEVERLYTFTAPTRVNKKMHDVDRIGEDRILIADIAYDRVAIVNTTTGLIHWQWDAQQEFSFEGGGDYPADWTHINDIEQLPDGRIMASLRNQDQVIFLDPKTGMQQNWTLGAEDDYSTLYEQHNPDFIPEENGGPAVIVADSHNNRIVEFKRTGDGWEQTWEWSDSDLVWPRDADRLPNGNTLIVDSNGGRLLEIDRAGDIVWSVDVKSLYDAERLGTGDESAGGPSATKAGLSSQAQNAEENEAQDSEESEPSGVSPRGFLRSVIPTKLWSSIAFILPAWAGLLDVVLFAGLVATTIGWAGAEIYWSDRITFTAPVQFK